MAKAKNVITQIKKAARQRFSADEKFRIVLEGLSGETSISDRKHYVHVSTQYASLTAKRLRSDESF